MRMVGQGIPTSVVYRTNSSQLVPVLLTTPTAAGTVAAVRLLGSRGIPVTIAGNEVLAAGRWSRYASQSVHCPSVQEVDLFMEWLVTFGRRNPGQVLLPTSDETAWLFASNAEALKPYFKMYQPPLQVTLEVLDKKRFWLACRRARVETAPSWFPANETELRLLAPSLPYPILIKPRTQVHRIRKDKGVVVHSKDALLPVYRLIEERERYLPAFGPALEDASRPFLQEFARRLNDPVYSVSGFIEREHDEMVARGSMKILQRWPPPSVGVCFEARPIEPTLLEAVKRLCHEIGHFGIFEAEFLRLDGKWVAIDFNPRFYQQMGLDIARGLPMPLLAYLAACRENEALENEMARSASALDIPNLVVRDGVRFWATVAVMRLLGLLGKAEQSSWTSWDNRAKVLDTVFDVRDPVPGLVHAVSEIRLAVKSIFRRLIAKCSFHIEKRAPH
jgi:D-aspartate ligase